jgi:hypothetical protein
LFAAALAGLRPYVHYYYPTLPGLTLLAAPTVVALIDRSKAGSWRRRVAGAAAPLLLVGVLVLPFLGDNMRLVGMSPTEQAVTLYGEDGKWYFGPAAAVAEHIRASTKAGEQIYVWASEPQIYVLSGRKSAGYYIYTYPLELAPSASTELVDQLLRRPPALVVSYHGFTPNDLQKLANTLGLRRSATIGGYDIWAAPHRTAQ